MLSHAVIGVDIGELLSGPGAPPAGAVAAIGVSGTGPCVLVTDAATTCHPRPELAPVDDRLYRAYRRLYPATAAIVHGLAGYQRERAEAERAETERAETERPGTERPEAVAAGGVR